ncbi:N-acetylglucosamine-6-phosphate deacetylase [Arthrobacter sp. B3I4]|uniref:N-acetylglucosamine-6-phosphate deacetylase n=1 Tax=Arthrobacter sp. B3I4 TaxID=3042267 RepID=UPI0027888E51|nr:N-acetylglucosamine-6-phosphate deacetylase [Arthrobacter sp. B3I4]MDQ0755040.1 N-acetylglucosamine-6-phosphate deacetylase [Arthrobacter sp. B3I4]
MNDRPSHIDDKSFLIRDVTAVDATKTIENAWISVAAGRIQDLGQGDSWQSAAVPLTAVVEGRGGYVTPGFIDVHFHGGGTYSNEQGPQAIMAALAAHHTHGTTRAVVSFVANPVPELMANLRMVAELAATSPLVLGSHLEGPFLAKERRGAHSAQHLVAPADTDIGQLIEAGRGTLRQVTIDPDQPGAFEAIGEFSRAGVRVAIGHTEASYETSLAAFEAGATMLTHAFNAMPGIHHREPGPIIAALDRDAYMELILDGIHVHPRVAAMVFRLAAGRVVLVSDAMAAAGAPDGSYLLGELHVEAGDGRAVLAGTSTLAGSTLTLDNALRLGISNNIGQNAVVEALTLAPARLLNLQDTLGLLSPGYEADLALFDSDWKISATYAAGRCLFTR